MRAYSGDLRQKIVAALERGTSKSQAARLFGVSLSSFSSATRGEGTAEGLPRPEEKGSGRPPKLDENASRLLEEDVKERPAATPSNKDAVS